MQMLLIATQTGTGDNGEFAQRLRLTKKNFDVQ